MNRIPHAFQLIFLSLALALPAHSEPGGEEEFDRLDGKGASGKRVDLIEWEGNIEVHVYPAHSLAGLSLKLDKGSGGRKVLVLGYRFAGSPKETLVRRGVLGIPLTEPFQTYYEDLGDYEKITVTNHTLATGGPTGLREFTLDPPPAQLYPEGHPALMPAESDSPTAAKPKAAEAEKPAADPGALKEFSW